MRWPLDLDYQTPTAATGEVNNLGAQRTVAKRLFQDERSSFAPNFVWAAPSIPVANASISRMLDFDKLAVALLAGIKSPSQRSHAKTSSRTRPVENVGLWHDAEVPPAAKEGRSRLQSGLWQAVHEHVYEFTP